MKCFSRDSYFLTHQMPVLPHIETSQLICTADQLTGFYMRATLAFNGLRRNEKLERHYTDINQQGLSALFFLLFLSYKFFQGIRFYERDHLFSTCTKFSEKVVYLTCTYEGINFQKSLCKY